MWRVKVLILVFSAYFCPPCFGAKGDSTNSVTTCANEKVDLFVCELFEEDTVIKIVENGTFWGRQNNRSCLTEKGTPKNWNCSLDISEIVKKECNGKVSCQFNSSNEFFGADPCPGTPKYSLIYYQCIPKEDATPSPITEPPEEVVDGPTLCYLESMRIDCGKKKIKTKKVFFGRGDKTTCIYGWVQVFTQNFNFECDASEAALKSIQKRCDGQNKCDIWNIVGNLGGSINVNLSGSGHVNSVNGSDNNAIGANAKISCTPANMPYLKVSHTCVD